MKDLSDTRDEVEGWHNLVNHIEELAELAELGDESLRGELEVEINLLEMDIQRRELDTLLSGPYDKGMPCSPSTPEWAAPIRTIGQPCWSACIYAG